MAHRIREAYVVSSRELEPPSLDDLELKDLDLPVNHNEIAPAASYVRPVVFAWQYHGSMAALRQGAHHCIAAPYDTRDGRVYIAKYNGPHSSYYSANSKRFFPTMHHAQVYLEDRFGKYFFTR